MSETTTTDNRPLYKHPNIREQSLDTIMIRLETVRSRRVMAAIEANTLKQAKIASMQQKDIEKFEKLMTKTFDQLVKAADLLDKIDENLRVATSLHNNAKQLGDLL